MAKGAKTGGRKAGTPNRKTQEQITAVVSTGITPLEYLLQVMRAPLPPEVLDQVQQDPKGIETLAVLANWHDRRIDAAKAAAPYVHPKLSQVEMNANVTTDHESALDELEGAGDTASPQD